MTGTRLRNVQALEAALAASEARAAAAEAKASDAEEQVAALTLMIEKLRRALYGRRSERKERLLNQLDLALDGLTTSATEDALFSRSRTSKPRPAQRVFRMLLLAPRRSPLRPRWPFRCARRRPAGRGRRHGRTAGSSSGRRARACAQRWTGERPGRRPGWRRSA